VYNRKGCTTIAELCIKQERNQETLLCGSPYEINVDLNLKMDTESFGIQRTTFFDIVQHLSYI
jgi:hypothetical protein